MSSAKNKPGNAPSPASGTSAFTWSIYVLLGALFGITLTQSEVLSWFRIQEMFRFQSPHMYLIIASAVVVSAISVALIKRLRIKTLYGEPIVIPPKDPKQVVRYLAGGTTFGLGWSLVGACPGPLFALLGNGISVMVVAIASAVLGTLAYGYLRPRLPH